MQVHCHAERNFPCPSHRVFDLIVDPVRFPLAFRGFGLIPAIRSISLNGSLAVGEHRRIHNADGTTLIDQITALDSPSLHTYILGGFKPPFSWLVTRGDARWTVCASGPLTQVRWDYAFTLTSPLVWPLAAVLLQLFMARAMQRCLENMAPLLASSDLETAATAR
jgi:hypothetical protein